jgi:hypothetical protein
MSGGFSFEIGVRFPVDLRFDTLSVNIDADGRVGVGDAGTGSLLPRNCCCRASSIACFTCFDMTGGFDATFFPSILNMLPPDTCPLKVGKSSGGRVVAGASRRLLAVIGDTVFVGGGSTDDRFTDDVRDESAVTVAVAVGVEIPRLLLEPLLLSFRADDEAKRRLLLLLLLLFLTLRVSGGSEGGSARRGNEDDDDVFAADRRARLVKSDDAGGSDMILNY